MSNDEHLQRALRRLLEMRRPTHRHLGLAFKENTDGLRESPVVSLIEYLVGKGVGLKIFDPQISLETVHGSISPSCSPLPHIGRLLVSNCDQLIASPDVVVIAQKPSPQNAARLLASELPRLDLTRLTDDPPAKEIASDAGHQPNHLLRPKDTSIVLKPAALLRKRSVLCGIIRELVPMDLKN